MITVITIREPQNDINFTEEVNKITITDASVIAAQGEKGDSGDDGKDGADSTVAGPAGPQNLFIQVDEPVYNAPFLWLKPLGNGKFDLRYGDGE